MKSNQDNYIRELNTNETNKWGKEVISMALEYGNYEWYATDKNIKHGIDNNGIEVDTPDITWTGTKLDCSGLLTVCWDLPQKISTRVIPDYANVVENIDEIQQGDVKGKGVDNIQICS